METGTVEALVLGSAQDGGVPHMGCSCCNCEAAASSGQEQYAVSMALVWRPQQAAGAGSATASPPPPRVWLLDCGPDIKRQWRMLQSHAPGAQLQGIFLTHLHMGHYIGLFQFGREAFQQDHLPLFVTTSAAAFLRANQPWAYYLDQGVFVLTVMTPGEAVQLAPGLAVQPISVPHRQEFSNCVGFSVAGPHKSLFWCPDIDSWGEWERDVHAVVLDHTLSFLDACFYDPAKELKRRDVSQIPHPPVPDTLARLEGLGSKVVLIHMNHTNPIWDAASREAEVVRSGGFAIGRQGDVHAL